jgi:stearoyl-CoA desaturase (delta-9 desaturase)
MLWWMTPVVLPGHRAEYNARWAPDLARDRVHAWLDRWHFLFPVLMGAGLYAAGGMPWLVWGGFVRSVLLLHSTWLVNSASHIWGARPYATRDTATNLWWVALVAYGEGWHNNHHAFPTSARHGLRWWQFDMTYGVIRLMSWVKLVASVKLPRETRATSLPAEAARPRNGAGSEGGHTSGSPSIQRRGPAVAFTAAAPTGSPTGERCSQWA